MESDIRWCIIATSGVQRDSLKSEKLVYLQPSRIKYLCIVILEVAVMENLGDL